MFIIGLETTDDLQMAIDSVRRHECEASFIGEFVDSDGRYTVLMEYEPCNRNCLISLLIGPDIISGPANWPSA